MKILFIAVLFFQSLIFAPLALAEQSARATSPNFSLSGEVTAETAIELIGELEEFRAVLLAYKNLPATSIDRPIDIYVISDPDIFGILDVQESFVAVYTNSIVGPRIFVNGNMLLQDMKTLRNSLRHEYAHHFNAYYRETATPRWLDEGLAEYYAGYEKISELQYKIGLENNWRGLIQYYPIEGWFPLNGIINSIGQIEKFGYGKTKFMPSWKGPRPGVYDLFYAQSWGLVHYLKNQPDGANRINAITEYIINLRSGALIEDTADNYEDYLVEKEKFESEIENQIIAIMRGTENELWTEINNHMSVDELPHEYVTLETPIIQPQINVENLSPDQAEAIQFFLMSTVVSNATINTKMKEMRQRLQQAPDLSLTLKLSEAAQNIVLGNTTLAIETLDQILSKAPQTPHAEDLRIHAQFQELNNQYFQNGHKLRNMVKPQLEMSPNDPDLLVMMALSGTRDIESPPIEVHNALKRIEELNFAQRYPLKALPLINLYVELNKYEDALEIARRASVFMPQQNYALERLISDLETEIKNANQ